MKLDRDRHDEAKEAGLCSTCRIRFPQRGRRTCSTCLARCRGSYKKTGQRGRRVAVAVSQAQYGGGTVRIAAECAKDVPPAVRETPQPEIERKCLQCERSFMAPSPYLRICPPCKNGEWAHIAATENTGLRF